MVLSEHPLLQVLGRRLRTQPEREQKIRQYPEAPKKLRAVLAKVYKGTSWFDGKECIVLDYSETSIVAGWIRDEIRMIEPKFYLGEVFGEKTRIFHFTLQF